MRVVPAGARVARGAVKAGRTDLRTVRLRGSAPALSATQSRSDEARPDGDWRQRRGLLRTKGVADGALVADPLSRVVLSTRRSRTVADDQARRVGNLAESISNQPGYRFELTMAGIRKKKAAKTQKGDQTKALILETALEIFRERGYEETTMRAIAEKAGLSLGNAYYYFHSKEYLIQAFYQRLHDEHLAAALPALEKKDSFKARLLTVMRL